MQQYRRQPELATFRTRRTRPTLHDAVSPTTPAPGIQGNIRTLYATARPRNVLSILLLLCVGLLIEALLLALLLALASPASMTDALQNAAPGLLPAGTAMYHLAALHRFSAMLRNVTWLNPATLSGRAHDALALMVLTMLLVLLAAYIGTRIIAGPGSTYGSNKKPALLWIVLLPAIVFGATMVCAPATGGIMAQDMLWYGFYGRMIVLYHVNPYMAAPAMFSHDMLNSVISSLHLPIGLPTHSPVSMYGPIWLDVCLLVALLAQNSIAHFVYSFRIIGLLAHVLNSVLLWLILTRWKPEVRVSTVLLYAWNPLVLLLGVAQMHLQILVTLFILLATFFFLHASKLLGWIFVLLAVLVCPFYLLLLPLYLRLLGDRAYALSPGRRLLGSVVVCVITLLVLLLAYAPYWQDWGIAGLGAQMQALFIQDAAVNSLDATFLALPLQHSPVLMWIVSPHTWSLLGLAIVGVFLLFSCWLADTPELVMLCGSWLLLLMVILQPVYCPWYVIVPLALAVCAINRGTLLLVTMLVIGAVVAYYSSIWQPGWSRQALLTIGMPLLCAGWVLFVSATWRMTRAKLPEEKHVRPRIKGLSRPAWLSRASWPSRPPRR